MASRTLSTPRFALPQASPSLTDSRFATRHLSPPKPSQILWPASRDDLQARMSKMASSLAFRRVAADSRALCRLTNPLRAASVAPNVARPFNTSSEMRLSDDDESDVEVDVKRSPFSSCLKASGSFSGVYDREWPPTRSLSQVLNLRMEASGSRTAWDVKEDDDALSLRMDMPGLSTKDVKVSVEQNTLMIKGEREKESGKGGRRYTSTMDLLPNLFKHEQIKAEMKNGVLKVVVAKVKEEEKKDVLRVTIE